MKKQLKISVPDDIAFSDLKLSRDDKNGITFDANIINAVCEASEIDPKIFWESHEDNMAGMIMAWYAKHIEQGGERDAVADDLIAETIAEDESGGGISHPPGSA